jgi:alpha-L-rhamnosidase
MALLLLALCAACAQAQLPPTDLRVEYAASPLAVDRAAPRFSWAAPSAQWGWRLTASLSPTLSPPLWDSGEHISPASSQHAYGGPPLPADTDVYWAVATAPSATAPFTRSSVARFTTGLLAPSDWGGAQWIGGFNQLRTNFTLGGSAPPPRARAYVTGVGCYQLFVNGHAVSNDTDGRATIANPGFSTIFSTRLLYNAYDVAALLVPGENVVGLRLGSCKYGYLGEFCTDGPAACNSGLLRLSLGSGGGGGSASDVVTGPGWQGAPSSILVDHFYNGETHDGGVERAQAGWSAPGGGGGGAPWAPAAVRPTAPTATLSAHAMPQIIELGQPAQAAALLPVSATSWTFDLGLNGAGRCTLRLAGPTPPGHAVSLLHAEVLRPADNGADVTFACPAACCADGGNCASQNFTYITAGVGSGEVEEFSPAFAYSGFRYVQVVNWPPSAPPPTLQALRCVQTSTAVESAGAVAFNASTPTGALFNAIQGMILRSQRSNLHSIPTDCPQREKR